MTVRPLTDADLERLIAEQNATFAASFVRVKKWADGTLPKASPAEAARRLAAFVARGKKKAPAPVKGAPVTPAILGPQIVDGFVAELSKGTLLEPLSQGGAAMKRELLARLPAFATVMDAALRALTPDVFAAQHGWSINNEQGAKLRLMLGVQKRSLGAALLGFAELLKSERELDFVSLLDAVFQDLDDYGKAGQRTRN
jgi:hypothetical protein